MTEELLFKGEAAAEYDRAFAHVTGYFMPFVLRAADVRPGMRVLDIATGTGLPAEAALAAVGPTGHVRVLRSWHGREDESCIPEWQEGVVLSLLNHRGAA
jgi:hypothetical protein